MESPRRVPVPCEARGSPVAQSLPAGLPTPAIVNPMPTATRSQHGARSMGATSVAFAAGSLVLALLNPLWGALAGLAAMAFALTQLIGCTGSRRWHLVGVALAALSLVAGLVYGLTSVPVDHETMVVTSRHLGAPGVGTSE